MTDERRATTGVSRIAASFGLSGAASAGLAIVYALGGQPQLEGALLGVALGGIGVGLVLWAKKLMPQGPFEEPREVVPSEVEERPEAEEAAEAGAEAVERRGFLAWMLAVAVGALGAAAVFPIRSLGTRPGGALFHTPWRDGLRLVTTAGIRVRAEDVTSNGVLTVFPEGHAEASDAQTLLIRLPEDVEPPEGAVEGFIAFSKVCTHAGCPVGLYQAATKELFCPCHQSVFDVLAAARPTAGPATRPLPQLPIDVDGDGFLVARGDFPEPVGPGFWSRGR